MRINPPLVVRRWQNCCVREKVQLLDCKAFCMEILRRLDQSLFMQKDKNKTKTKTKIFITEGTGFHRGRHGGSPANTLLRGISVCASARSVVQGVERLLVRERITRNN